ncbi:MAG TPA: SRPBCC family protein, partial [Thermoanaerobaculia bacterium]|nr:SRPBCC family protein [Thermoanaerobaculia bacterium]
RPLAVGAAGGHGPIRYTVTAYEPGRRVEFTFAPTLRLDGTHTLTVEPDGEGACVVYHVIAARPRGRMRLAWPLMFRCLHDALIEDLLDNAEEALTGRVAARARWSWWVRWLRSRRAPRHYPAARRGGEGATGVPHTTP